jgi:sortase B
MSAAALTLRRAIRLTNGAFDTIALIAVTLILAAGLYALWDADQVFREAEFANYATYKPTVDPLSFEELKAINPEVFAWLTVYGTHIDYPVNQGEDNMKYVNTNAMGNYSLSGAIFLDNNCKRDFSDFSSILYGHHMEKNAMFGELGQFANKKYFDDRKYGSLYYDGRDHGIEFFAFLHVDAYDGKVFRTGITGESAQREYLAMLLERAMHTRETDVTINDRFVLLATCSSGTTNGRDILVGRITDELYEDAFMTTETTGAPRIPGTDGLVSLWELIPLWAKLAAAAALLLTAALALDHMRRRPKQKLGLRQKTPEPQKG